MSWEPAWRGWEAAWPELLAVCERAYPDEACGWITGTTAGAPSVQVATTGGRDAFVLSDDDLLALVAAMRSPTPPVALFHSHPDGDAELSARDGAGLALYPLPHVVVAVAGGRAHAATLYAYRAGQRPNAHLAVARWRRA
jgi:proteasome lid subunit RPN8/RPN11